MRKTKQNWVTKIIVALLLWTVVMVGPGMSLVVGMSQDAQPESTAYAGEPTTPATPLSPLAAGDTANKTEEGKRPDGFVPAIDQTNMCVKTTKTDHLCPGGNTGFITTNKCSEAGATNAPKGSDVGQKALQSFSAIILAVENTLRRLLWPILHMIGDLLDTKLLFGKGMEERLREIWVPIRNIINILFVIALVGLALYNVLGVDSENSQWSIKAMLPKLIIAVIVVNFSFVGIKVFLDSINVLTTAIFAIPDKVSTTLDKKVLSNDQTDPIAAQRTMRFCQEIYGSQADSGSTTPIKDGIEKIAYINVSQKFKALNVGSYQDFQKHLITLKNINSDLYDDYNAEFEKAKKDFAHCKEGGQLTELGEKYYETFGSNNAAVALAINMGDILFYENPYALSPLGSNQFESLTINIIFSLLLYIVYTVSYLVLFIVLLARLVVLWLGLALSPVLALALVIPQAKEQLGAGELINKFVAHAIAPVGIAMVMTVGWVMLGALKDSTQGYAADVAISNSGMQVVPGLPIPGLDTLQGLLVSLLTVAVVWIGVFAVANKTVAEKLIGVVKENLERAGGWIAKAPFKYTPWVPVEIKDDEGNMVKKDYTPEAFVHAAERHFSDKHVERKQALARDLGMYDNVKSIDNFGSQSKDLGEVVDIGLHNQKRLGDGDIVDKKFINVNETSHAIENAMENGVGGEAGRKLAIYLKEQRDAGNTAIDDKGKVIKYLKEMRKHIDAKKGGSATAGVVTDSAHKTLKQEFGDDKANKVYDKLNVKTALAKPEEEATKIVAKVREDLETAGYTDITDKKVATLVNLKIQNEKEDSKTKDEDKPKYDALTASVNESLAEGGAQNQGDTDNTPPAAAGTAGASPDPAAPADPAAPTGN